LILTRVCKDFKTTKTLFYFHFFKVKYAKLIPAYIIGLRGLKILYTFPQSLPACTPRQKQTRRVFLTHNFVLGWPLDCIPVNRASKYWLINLLEDYGQNIILPRKNVTGCLEIYNFRCSTFFPQRLTDATTVRSGNVWLVNRKVLLAFRANWRSACKQIFCWFTAHRLKYPAIFEHYTFSTGSNSAYISAYMTILILKLQQSITCLASWRNKFSIVIDCHHSYCISIFYKGKTHCSWKDTVSILWEGIYCVFVVIWPRSVLCHTVQLLWENFFHKNSQHFCVTCLFVLYCVLKKTPRCVTVKANAVC